MGCIYWHSQGNLLLSTPNVLVHEVDVWSPLCPSQNQARARMDALSAAQREFTPRATGARPGDVAARPHHYASAGGFEWPCAPQRFDDLCTGQRQAWLCRSCGETFDTEEILRLHCAYNVRDNICSGHDARTSCSICGETFPAGQNMLTHMSYVGAPRRPLHGGVADLFYTDVRSILMVLWRGSKVHAR